MQAGSVCVDVDAAAWLDAGPVSDIPLRGARVVTSPLGDIAVFRTASGSVFALRDRCPHLGGPLSEGIVHGDSVTCPLHNWVISLLDGTAQGADQGCTGVVRLREEGGRVLLCRASLRAALAASMLAVADA